MPEIVALTAALADAREHGVAAVLIGHVADKLHDKHGLADARAAEQADLATLGVGREQVYDLDAGLQYLRGGGDIREGGSLTVNGHILLRVDRPLLVDRLADDVEHTAESGLADGHFNRRARIDGGAAAGHTVGGEQRDAADAVLTYMLHSLHDDLAVFKLHLYCVIDIRHLAGRKLYVNDRAYDPSDDAVFHSITSYEGVLRGLALNLLFLLFERRGTAHDLGYLRRDCGLTGAVELEVKLADEALRAVGSGGHGRHSGRVLAAFGIQQYAHHLVVQIQLHHILKNAVCVRSEDEHLTRSLFPGRRRRRQKLHMARLLTQSAYITLIH